MTDCDLIAKIRSNLWNDVEDDQPASLTYSDALMEQYKLYVELADRVSQRRGVANSFFLLVNSTAVVILGSLGISLDQVSPWLLVFPTIILVCICGTWYYMVKRLFAFQGGVRVSSGARLGLPAWSRARVR